MGEILSRGEDFATPIFSSELAGSQVAVRPERSDLNTHKFASSWSALPDVARGCLTPDRRSKQTGDRVSEVESDVVAVVVDYHADQFLIECVDSLFDNGVSQVVVVENGEVGSVPAALLDHDVVLVSPGVNLGYGRGVNRGVAVARATPFVLVSNPDVVVHDGAVAALVSYLDHHRDVALVGPTILRPDGTVYPSMRVFPNPDPRRGSRVARPAVAQQPRHPALPLGPHRRARRLGVGRVLLGAPRRL